MKTEKYLSKFFIVTTAAQIAFYTYKFIKKAKKKKKKLKF